MGPANPGGVHGAFAGIPLALLAGLFVAVTGALLASPYYTLAPLVGPALVFGVVALQRPWLLLALVLFLIPFDAFRGVGGVSVAKLAGLVLLAIGFFEVAIRKLPLERVHNNLWGWLLLLLTVMAIATFYTPYPETAREEVRQTVTVLLVFALTLLYTPDEKAVDRITAVILGAIALSAALGLLGYFLKIEAFVVGLNDPHSMLRVTGGAKDPNVASSIFIFGLPLAAHRIAIARSVPARLLFAVIFMILMLAQVFTHSRGGFLVMMFSLTLIAWHYRRYLNTRRLMLGIAFSLLGVLSLPLLVPSSVWERQLSLVDSGEDRSLGRRSSYLLVAGDAIAEAPLIGHGPGTFHELYARSVHAKRFATGADPNLHRQAHNTYVEVVVGSGIAGLVLFLGLLWRAWRNLGLAARSFLANGHERMAEVAYGYRLAFVSLCAYLAIISQFTLKLLWVTIALSAVLLQLARSLERAPAAQAPQARKRWPNSSLTTAEPATVKRSQ